MRIRLSLHRSRPGSSTPVASTASGQHQSTSTDEIADPEGLTPGRRGEDYADGVDAGHIVRTRPRNGSSVPMGSTVDYVVASSAGRPPDALVGDSSFVDHDATARLKHEAP